MSHIDGDSIYHYPLAGDDKPARGDAKVLLLTIGNQCVVGNWDDTGFYKAWAPMPKRDKSKEATLNMLRKP